MLGSRVQRFRTVQRRSPKLPFWQNARTAGDSQEGGQGEFEGRTVRLAGRGEAAVTVEAHQADSHAACEGPFGGTVYAAG